jgi:UDP-N-acetyl-D-glucosamine dehydrogenase
LAGEVNTSMPLYVVHQVADALNARKKSLNGSKVLVLGLAYKANVDDDRESPSYTLLDLLHKRGAKVAYYDPYVPVIRLTREHPHWAGLKSVSWNKKTIAGFDAVLISTAHGCVNYRELARWAKLIVDTRNAMVTVKAAGKKVRKA